MWTWGDEEGWDEGWEGIEDQDRHENLEQGRYSVVACDPILCSCCTRHERRAKEVAMDEESEDEGVRDEGTRGEKTRRRRWSEDE